MRIEEDQLGWVKARALQRIATAALTEYRRHLLMEFIDAYLPLEGPSLDQFNHLLLTPDFKEAQMLAKTTFEKGLEKGIEEGQRRMVLDLLVTRFGELSESARQRLDALPTERLSELSRQLLLGKSLVDLGLEDPSGNGASS